MRSGAGAQSGARFERVVTKKAALIEVKSKSGGAHSFSETEKVRRREGEGQGLRTWPQRARRALAGESCICDATGGLRGAELARPGRR